MVQVTDIAIASLSIDELKTKIKRLNSKAGQMKMDLHDLAEGLPTDYEQLTDVAAKTYDIFHQIDGLKKQLIILEQNRSD